MYLDLIWEPYSPTIVSLAGTCQELKAKICTLHIGLLESRRYQQNGARLERLKMLRSSGYHTTRTFSGAGGLQEGSGFQSEPREVRAIRVTSP